MSTLQQSHPRLQNKLHLTQRFRMKLLSYWVRTTDITTTDDNEINWPAEVSMVIIHYADFIDFWNFFPQNMSSENDGSVLRLTEDSTFGVIGLSNASIFWDDGTGMIAKWYIKFNKIASGDVPCVGVMAYRKGIDVGANIWTQYEGLNDVLDDDATRGKKFVMVSANGDLEAEGGDSRRCFDFVENEEIMIEFDRRTGCVDFSVGDDKYGQNIFCKDLWALGEFKLFFMGWRQDTEIEIIDFLEYPSE